jgi:hypothetical protein
MKMSMDFTLDKKLIRRQEKLTTQVMVAYTKGFL